MRRRVVVVDDDAISRRGLAELLADHPSIEVVAAVSHEEATRWSEEWDEADIAVIDAADDRARGDQFPGVAVVEAVRRQRSSGQTMVVVITAHFFDDALRRRMREAQADYFYHRSEIADAEALVAAVLQPAPSHLGVPPESDPEALHRLGITRSTRVNRAVNFASEHGGPSGLLGGRQGRRASARVRAAFNRVAQLQVVNEDGTVPERPQEHPSLQQVDRFVRWATRTKH